MSTPSRACPRTPAKWNPERTPAGRWTSRAAAAPRRWRAPATPHATAAQCRLSARRPRVLDWAPGCTATCQRGLCCVRTTTRPRTSGVAAPFPSLVVTWCCGTVTPSPAAGTTPSWVWRNKRSRPRHLARRTSCNWFVPVLCCAVLCRAVSCRAVRLCGRGGSLVLTHTCWSRFFLFFFAWWLCVWFCCFVFWGVVCCVSWLVPGLHNAPGPSRGLHSGVAPADTPAHVSRRHQARVSAQRELPLHGPAPPACAAAHHHRR